MPWEDRAYNREPRQYRSGGAGFGILLPPTRLALVLMVVNLAVFLIQAFTGEMAGFSPLVYWGALTFRDGLAFTQPWRWITYQYLHGGGWHIFFNLVTMYFFLPFLEQRWGWKRTFAFYTAGGIAGGVAYGIMTAIAGSSFRMGVLIGASGSLLAVIGAIAAIAPDMQILLIVIPLTMRTLCILYTVLYTLTIIGDRNLADAAHLGGMAFGVGAVHFGAPFWRRGVHRWQVNRSRSAIAAQREEEQLIDRILQKVHDGGMNSLTRWERRSLKKATERQRARENARARRAL